MFALVNSSHLTILMVLFGLAWIGHLSSVALTAPMDNVEQWVWSQSLQWGYHKHPPLPTWLLALPQMLFGPTALTGQILGSLCTLSAAMIFANVVRQIWGKHNASIALLAGLCITFYNGRLNYYNHNVLLMLCVSLSAYCWWQISTTGRTFWWIALGASAGLGMLSKYQYLLVAGPSAYMIWQLKPWRSQQQLRGFGLAILTATLLFLPHLWWYSILAGVGHFSIPEHHLAGFVSGHGFANAVGHRFCHLDHSTLDDAFEVASKTTSSKANMDGVVCFRGDPERAHDSFLRDFSFWVLRPTCVNSLETVRQPNDSQGTFGLGT